MRSDGGLTRSIIVRVAALVRATHPLPAAAVTVLVAAVAAARGARGSTLALVLLSTAAGQASVGWSNDYLDRTRDRAAGRREKPIVAGDIRASSVLLGAVVALPTSAALSLALGGAEAAVMTAAVLSAWSYNVALKSTALSWLPYAVSFGLAPVFVWLATSRTLPPWWLAAGTALLGTAAHLLNVIPDLESDRTTSVRGLPHALGLRRSLLLACGVLAVVLVVVLVATAPPTRPQLVATTVAVVLIAAVAWAGLGERGRLGFRLTIAAVSAIVATFALSPAVARL